MNEVRIAVIGCGEHAQENLIPSLMQIDGARLVALCDRDRARAERAARPFKGTSIFESAHSLLGEKFLDAVILAGPPQMHVEAAHYALESGIHVFAEKPPAVNTAELVELAELAEKRGLITAVGHNLRYTNACQIMRDILSSPDFGNCLVMDVFYNTAGPRGHLWEIDSVLRSFLLSHAIHGVDLLLWTMGTAILVSAIGAETRNGATQMSSHVRFSDGGLGALVASSCGPHFQIAIRLLSDTDCTVHIDSLHRLFYYGRDNAKRWGRSWESRPLESGYQHAGYLGELQSFVEAIQRGGQTHPSFTEEIEVYRLIDSIEHQIKELPIINSS